MAPFCTFVVFFLYTVFRPQYHIYPNPFPLLSVLRPRKIQHLPIFTPINRTPSTLLRIRSPVNNDQIRPDTSWRRLRKHYAPVLTPDSPPPPPLPATPALMQRQRRTCRLLKLLMISESVLPSSGKQLGRYAPATCLGHAWRSRKGKDCSEKHLPGYSQPWPSRTVLHR